MGKAKTDNSPNVLPPTAGHTEMSVENILDNIPEQIRQTAFDLAHDVLFYFASERKGKAPSKHASTLRRTVQEMTERHDILYKGMLSKLNITNGNYDSVFLNVAQEVFRDKQYHWGRLVTVYAFGAEIAKRLDKSLLRRFSKVIGEYIVQTFGLWIHTQGGWDAFDEYFPEQNNIEDTLWKGLAVTVCGLGALATVVAAFR